ncbi:MAG: lysine-sensitive aspartokinase 3 [Ignavibacteria bacterium]
MIVMKFGGTSIKDSEAIRRVIGIIKSQIKLKPVIVLSAIAGATNQLEEISISAKSGEIIKSENNLFQLKERHLKIVKETLSGTEHYERVVGLIEKYFREIESLIKGVYLLSELTPKASARILSYGELLSTTIITSVMEVGGVDSELLDSRQLIKTDRNFLKAEPQVDIIKELVSAQLIPIVKAGKVSVLQGFIGSNDIGETTILGRGGSDYTASLIGLAINADGIEIWTDVDGMLTADPRMIEGTKLIEIISFEEAAELAYFGAKVLHPLTIQPAVEKNIPVWIKNSLFPERQGTKIVRTATEKYNSVRAIASKEKIIVVNIFSTRMLNSYGFLKRIFEIFEKHQTSVDLIATSEVNVSLTLDDDSRLDDIVRDLSEFSIVNVETDKSLICVVGSNIKNSKGIAGRIFNVLSDYNITMISQGASLINISFVLERAVLKPAMQKLHNIFFN